MRFGNGEHKAPNLTAYDNGEFLWGRTIVDRLDADDISESQVIRFAKLAIFPDPQTAEPKERVMKKLEAANKTIEDLVQDTLQAVIKYATNDAVRTLEGQHHDVAEMPMHLFLSVPQSKFDPSLAILA